MSHATPQTALPYDSPVPVHGARQVKHLTYEMTALDRAYLKEALRGLGVTFKHFFVNFARVMTRQPIETVSYPDVKRPYPERFRALHRLLKRDDDSPRCVACYMCATACPAYAIHIVAGEREGSTEKFPEVFEIDELRCVDCGLCVEACPCDAIRMDTGIHPAPALRREETLLDKATLLEFQGLDDGNLPKTARTAERQQQGHH